MLATSVSNVTGYAVLMGFGSAMDTLCGQARIQRGHPAFFVGGGEANAWRVLWYHVMPAVLLMDGGRRRRPGPRGQQERPTHAPPRAPPRSEPQAYGARNYKMLGQVMQRAQAVGLATCLPIWLLFWNVGGAAAHARRGRPAAACRLRRP